MKLFIGIVLWCILFVLCWPLALLVLVLFPVFWLIALAFRILGIVINAVLSLLHNTLMLPSRLLAKLALLRITRPPTHNRLALV
jgi:hypothetical protein